MRLARIICLFFLSMVITINGYLVASEDVGIDFVSSTEPMMSTSIYEEERPLPLYTDTDTGNAPRTAGCVLKYSPGDSQCTGAVIDTLPDYCNDNFNIVERVVPGEVCSSQAGTTAAHNCAIVCQGCTCKLSLVLGCGSVLGAYCG